MIEEEKEEEQGKREDQEQGADQTFKVTTRDREMLAHVALVKYAAERHLQRLVFGVAEALLERIAQTARSAGLSRLHVIQG